MYYIQKFGTYGSNGYNATRGGDGRSYVPYSDQDIIIQHCTEAKYISARTARYFHLDPKTVNTILDKYNIHHLNSDEVNQVLISERGNIVCQIDCKSNEIIAQFNSVADANEAFGKSRTSSAIYEVLRGKNKHAQGYKWSYLKK